MASDIKISELSEISSNKTINQVIINDRANSSDPGITRKISINNLLPTYDPADLSKRAIVGNAQLVSTAQSPGNESVDTNVIRDSAITTSKVADKAITGAKIGDETITNNNIGNNAIDGRNISPGANVTVSTLSASQITAVTLTVKDKTTFNTREYTWPTSYISGRYLKVDASGNLSWDTPVAGSGTTLVYNEVLPVGAILPWGANSTPDNFLMANGEYFDGTLYPDLSAVLGTTYGAISGTKYFKLPNLQGKIPVGAGINVPDASGNTQTFTLGTSGGEYKHQLTVAELPAHTHNIVCRATVTSGGAEMPPTDGSGVISNYSTDSTGGDQAHNNIQPYVVTNYIIKAKPDPRLDFNLVIGTGLSANTLTGNINLSGGAIQVKVDNNTINIDGLNQLSVRTGGISGQQLTGQQTGSAPIYGARAWAYFDCTRDSAGVVTSSNTERLIRGSGNIASITKLASGRYSVVFSIPMQDANYTVIGCSKNNTGTSASDGGIICTYFQAASGCLLNITDPTNNNYNDPQIANIAVFR